MFSRSRRLRWCLLPATLFLAHGSMRAQTEAPALATVRAAVKAELFADANDHAAWTYRDHDVEPDRDRVLAVVETPKGDLQRLLILNGRPLTGQAAAAELARIHDFVNSPGEQAKKHKDGAHDDAQARELLNMLPTAFTWEITGQTADAVFLRFRPNPAFRPSDMQARVLGVMSGEMTVARSGDRIKSLRGTLSDDVRLGYGLLGKLDKGGTFDVERREVGPGRWQITETHVHIGGHALLFKSIGTQEDEVKTDFRLSTAPDLKAAEQQIIHLP